MKSPIETGNWLILEEAESTQDLAALALAKSAPHAAILAHRQTAGRGRLGRAWLSEPGASLTLSLLFRAYADHPAPHLVGMAVALAAAELFDLELQWPNDLVSGQRKVGGMLTELFPDAEGRKVPVVGLGLNLNQTVFPEAIAGRAASLRQLRGETHEPESAARRLMARLESTPEPDSWAYLEPRWTARDRTAGKRFLLPSGLTVTATGIGPEGQLRYEGGEALAAESLLGQPASPERA